MTQPHPQPEYIITEKQLQKISFDFILNVRDPGTTVHNGYAPIILSESERLIKDIQLVSKGGSDDNLCSV